ncbi:MAG: DUF4189 domain-containing protein [Luteimonas sp.]
MRPLIHGFALCCIAASLVAASAASAQKKPAKPAAKASKYGALAVDRKQGFVYGFAYDQPSRAEANQFAQDECSKRNGQCSVVVEFAGEGCTSYHTISAEDGTAYGWGTGATQQVAEANSLKECTAFADGKASCGNHVWACNSKDVAPFKVLREDLVKARPAKTDCLVQYETTTVNGNDDWTNDYKSPVYRLSAVDCPLTTSSQFHAFHHGIGHDDGKVWQEESNPEKKNPALRQKGLDMAEAFFAWMQGKPAPESGIQYRTNVSVTASTASDENVEYLGRMTGRSNDEQVHGVCIDYAPPGIQPVAIYGAEHCQRWVR